MRSFRRPVALHLALLLPWFLPAAVAAPIAPAGVVAHRDLAYAEVGGRVLRLDLYLPAEPASPPPLVAWVHGGAWRAGSKARCPLVWMVERGFAVASVQYRLSDVATFPAQIHDLKGAIRWLRANAATYGYDAERIGAAGASAGGHLVALLGTSGGIEALEGDVGGNPGPSSRVQAVYDLFGPADLTGIPANVPGFAENPVTLLLGGTPAEVPETARLASPVSHVTADDPAFLIAHGTEDPLVPVAQSRLLDDRLRAAGVESTLVILEGAGHGGPTFQTAELQEKVLSFFERHLRPGTGSLPAAPPRPPRPPRPPAPLAPPPPPARRRPRRPRPLRPPT